MAGLASNVPDWDGIPMLFDMQRFEVGHRVWGHGILSIALTSLLLAVMQVRWDWIGWIANRLRSRFLKSVSVAPSQDSKWLVGGSGVLVFAIIGLCAQVVHWPCDMVVSGGNGLSDWAIQPWWPFSSAAYVYPLIPWGDIGPTIIMMAGVIVIAKRNRDLSITSCLTIATLCGYMVVRGWFRGAFAF